jgi:TonB family protein
MATAQIPPRNEQQLDLYPRPVEPYIPEFEQVESRWTWKHFLALAGVSVAVHILFVLLLAAIVIVLPKNSPIVLTASQILNSEKNIYVDLAPDKAKAPVERPKTDIISDKDRRASTRTPSIDRKTLDRLRDNRAPGPPAASSAPAQAPAPAMQPQPQPQQPAGQQTQGQVNQPTPPATSQTAQVHTPNFGRGRTLPNFGSPSTAGDAVQQAARAAAEGHGAGGGDYGSGPARANTPNRDSLEIVSDTLGVDFAPYLARMRVQVYENWFAVMPEIANAPWRTKGVVVIEFTIMKDGSLTGLRLLQSSGNVALDRAAYAAISASNPMSQLPADFKADYLTMRAHFYYNPDRASIR